MIHKKKLIIFLITNNFRPYDSGVTRSLEILYKELKECGHNPSIITLDFAGQKDKQEEGIIRLYSPVKFTYKKNQMAIPLMPHNELNQLIQQKRPDLLHVHHPFLLGKVGLNLAKKYSIPIVYTYHTQYEKYLHYIPLPEKITLPVVQKLVTSFCHQVDGIIAPSLTIKELISKNIKTSIEVIPSGVDTIFYSKGPKKKLNKSIQLLTVSRFVQEKNIEFLLRVMGKLVHYDFNLTLIGYGAHEEFLKNYAYKKLDLSEKRIKFIIKPEKSELAGWYKKADFFLFASQTETQGMVLAEAMASGTPVIALDAAGSRDIITDGYNGRLVLTEEHMVQAINNCFAHYQEYANYCQNAWQTAQEYKGEMLTKKIINFYFQMLDCRKQKYSLPKK